MNWSQQAIKAIEPIYQQIMAQPFIQQLADGRLNPAQFHYYLQQDALYLAQYRKIMAAIAAKCTQSAHQRQFLHSAAATIEAELAVHQYFLSKDDQATYQPSISTLLYTGYLYQQLSTQPLAVIVASILPCFYLYQQVGAALTTPAISAEHPYYVWLNAYASEAFAQDVIAMVAIADELAQSTTATEREAMTTTFIMAAKMEWLFWDSAWQQQTWPI